MCVIFDSVFFRVLPWQMLLLILGVNPWLIFCFLLQPSLTHLALKGNLHRSFLFIKQEWGAANLIATPHSNKRASCSVQQMIKLQA
jgi:hypothetical protein